MGVEVATPEPADPGTQHVDPPTGIRLRLVVVVLAVTALVSAVVYAVWLPFDPPVLDDPCAELRVPDQALRCQFRPVQRG